MKAGVFPGVLQGHHLSISQKCAKCSLYARSCIRCWGNSGGEPGRPVAYTPTFSVVAKQAVTNRVMCAVGEEEQEPGPSAVGDSHLS